MLIKCQSTEEAFSVVAFLIKGTLIVVSLMLWLLIKCYTLSEQP